MQREMMFLILVISGYLNNNNLKVMYSSAYANIRCIYELLLKIHCIVITHFRAPTGATYSSCTVITYNCACARGYNVMQPISSGNLLEINTYSLRTKCTHSINSTEYLEKEVGDLIKHL